MTEIHNPTPIPSWLSPVVAQIKANVAEASRRIAAIDHEHPVLDKDRVNDALAKILAIVGLPMRPIRWLSDLDSGSLYIRTDGSFRADVSHTFEDGSFRSAITHPFIGDWNGIRNTQRGIALDTPLLRAEMRAYARHAYYNLDGIHYVMNPADVISATRLSINEAVFPDCWPGLWSVALDAAESGLGCFIVTKSEVFAIPRPAFMIANGQLHSETGPAILWTSGQKKWFWRGLSVDRWIIEEPERIDASIISKESNLEVRRVMIERFGMDRYVRESHKVMFASDPVHGDLYRIERRGEPAIVMLHVKNNTAEPDGTGREYWIRVHHHCRPFRARDKWVGVPQEMTPLNARASTWGLTGEVFKHLAEAS